MENSMSHNGDFVNSLVSVSRCSEQVVLSVNSCGRVVKLVLCPRDAFSLGDSLIESAGDIVFAKQNHEV